MRKPRKEFLGTAMLVTVAVSRLQLTGWRGGVVRKKLQLCLDEK